MSTRIVPVIQCLKCKPDTFARSCEAGKNPATVSWVKGMVDVRYKTRIDERIPNAINSIGNVNDSEVFEVFLLLVIINFLYSSSSSSSANNVKPEANAIVDRYFM